MPTETYLQRQKKSNRMEYGHSHFYLWEKNNYLKNVKPEEDVLLVDEIIRGRDNILAVAEVNIRFSISQLEELMRTDHAEFLFYLAYLFPHLLSSLAKNEMKIHSYRPDWLRSVTGLTYALNEILPRHLPLKHPNRLNLKSTKKAMNEIVPAMELCSNIGNWIFLKQNRYIKELCVSDHKPKPMDEESNEGYQQYVEKRSTDPEHIEFMNSFYENLHSYESIIRNIDNSLVKDFNFHLRDLANASDCLERLVNKNEIIINKNKLHEVFTRNIRSGQADGLFRTLTFGASNRDLFKSPLIPLTENGLLVASWIFKLQLHFHVWTEPILEQIDSRRSLGFYFEDYVFKTIKNSVDGIDKQVTIDKQDYPQVATYLQKLNKKDKFEIDIIGVKNNNIFLISCKGAKKELPKLDACRLWALFPYYEIKDRINDNLKDMRELEIERKCIENLPSIELPEIGTISIQNKTVVPVLVYSTVQPLGIETIKNDISNRVPDMLVTTPKKLALILSECV